MEFSAKASLTNHIVSIALAVITAAGTGYGFYYSTNYKLTKHDSDIDEVKSDIVILQDRIETEKINNTISTTEIKNMKESMDRIEKNQTEIIKLLQNR